MNRKIFAAIMIIFTFTVLNAMTASEFQEKLEQTRYPVELDFKGTPLSDALSNISKTSNVSIVASSEIANLPIDIYLPRGQTLKKVIDTIKNTNGLVSKIVNDTMILSKAQTTGKQEKETGTVFGKVTEIDKDSGIRGVTLSLGDDINTLVLSDVGGAFIIDNVKEGTYILKASKNGYNSNSQIVQVKADQSINVKMTLLKSGVTEPGEIETKKEELGQVKRDNGEIRDTKLLEVIYGDVTEIKKVVENVVPLDNMVINVKQNKILLVGSEDNIETATKLIEKLDVQSKQVEIEVEIWDISKDLSSNLGLNWSANPIDGTGEISKQNTAVSFSGSSGLNLGLSYGGFINGAKDEKALSVSLDMLKGTSDAEVLAKPRIVTLNGEKANFKVVNEEIVGYKETSDEDGNSEKAPLFKEAGVTLTVTPTIKSNETILIELNSKVSKFVGDSSFGDAAEKKSEATTKIRVKNNETIVIGGLTRKDKTKGVSKIPLLGDIPLFGALFRRQSTSNTEREIYIKITPKILGEVIPKNINESLVDNENEESSENTE
ncbi:MAG: carboxypeptidase regulatory-like domain-containing protein [Fusobacteriota bacterium]